MPTTVAQLADRIAAAAAEMHLLVERDRSRVSESEYLLVAADEAALERGETVKLRVSRHDAPWMSSPRDGRAPDYEVGAGTGGAADQRQDVHGTTAADAVAWLGRRFGRDCTAILARMTARGEAARAGAAARRGRAAATEAVMVAAIVAAAGDKPLKDVRAGRLCDELHGSLPRATRQRLAAEAVYQHGRQLRRAAVEAAIAAGGVTARRSGSGRTWYLDAAGRVESIVPLGGEAFSTEAVIAAWRAA